MSATLNSKLHSELTGRIFLNLGPEYRDKLRRLSEPDGRVFTLWTLFHVGIWALAAGMVFVTEETLWKLVLSIVLGNQLHAFTVLQHECGHGSAYRSNRANLWVGRLLAWFIFMPFTTFTELHRHHHAYLGQPGKDPDEWFYAGGPGQVFLRECLFMPYFVARSLVQQCPSMAKGRVVGELAFNTLTWAALIGVSIWLGYFEEVFYAFLLPMLILALAINPISRGYEHYPISRLGRAAPDRFDLRHNTVTVTNPLLGFLWANITYHVEHHLYPRVPFYRLPLLHRMLQDRQYTVEPYPLYSIFRKQDA